MAITVTQSNHYKYQLGSKQIDLRSDTLKVELMNATFVFDQDSHSNLSDVVADQLATGNGYTRGGHVLENQTWTESDSTDKGLFVCDNLTITAAGGDIGSMGGYLIVDASAVEDVELFTTIADTDFTGGSTYWTNADMGTTFDATTDLTLVADATGQYCKITFTDIGTSLVAGGLYRLKYDYDETMGGFEFKINGAALQVLGDAVDGANQFIDFYADEYFTGAHELRIYSKTNAAASGSFDNFSLKELGTIVSFVDFGTDVTIPNGQSIRFSNINMGIA